MYCSDPALSYEIPCSIDDCRWDLGYLDSSDPPGFCALIQLDPQIRNSGRIPDTLKPCVLWELSFGTLFEPTDVPTLGKFVVCDVLCVAVFAQNTKG